MVDDALDGIAHGGQGIVKRFSRLRGVAVHFQTEIGHLALERFNTIAALVQKRDQFRARSAKQLNGKRCFLRAIGHGLKSTRHIQQHLINLAQFSAGVGIGDVQPGKQRLMPFRTTIGFGHALRQPSHGAANRIERGTGHFRDRL